MHFIIITDEHPNKYWIDIPNDNSNDFTFCSYILKIITLLRLWTLNNNENKLVMLTYLSVKSKKYIKVFETDPLITLQLKDTIGEITSTVYFYTK